MTAVRAQAAGLKPRRFGSWYVAEHRLHNLRAYASTLVSTAIGNPLVYLYAFGVGLANLVNANSGGVDGVPYLTFVAPALVAQTAVQVAGEEGTIPMLLGFKWNPIFYAMNAAPISGNQIANGMALSMLARMVPTTAFYFVVTVLFGAVPSGLGVLSIVTAILAGTAVGTVLMAYASTIEEDKGQIALVQRFIIVPLFLFSGTFFPLTTLPVYLQWIGWISPLWHGTQLGRVLTYGMAEPAWLTAVHVVYLGAIALVGWRITQRIVTRRLNK